MLFDDFLIWTSFCLGGLIYVGFFIEMCVSGLGRGFFGLERG